METNKVGHAKHVKHGKQSKQVEQDTQAELVERAKQAVDEDIQRIEKSTGFRSSISREKKSRLVVQKTNEIRLLAEEEHRLQVEEVVRLQEEECRLFAEEEHRLYQEKHRSQAEDDRSLQDVLRLQQDLDSRTKLWINDLVVHQPRCLRILKSKLPSLSGEDFTSQLTALMAYDHNFLSWRQNRGKSQFWKTAMSWFCINVVDCRFQDQVLETLNCLLLTYLKIRAKQSSWTAPEDIEQIPESICYLRSVLIPHLELEFERFTSLPKKEDIATAVTWFQPYTSLNLEPMVDRVNSFLGGKKMWVGKIGAKKIT